MDFPIEKYKFIQRTTKSGAKQIIAISTYAGRTVKGIATCDPKDEFSIEVGKELAAARCNLKVAKKRAKRADTKVNDAIKTMQEAEQYYNRMVDYASDALVDVANAEDRLVDILSVY
jgi:hypothetical protein